MTHKSDNKFQLKPWFLWPCKSKQINPELTASPAECSKQVPRDYSLLSPLSRLVPAITINKSLLFVTRWDILPLDTRQLIGTFQWNGDLEQKCSWKLIWDQMTCYNSSTQLLFAFPSINTRTFDLKLPKNPKWEACVTFVLWVCGSVCLLWHEIIQLPGWHQCSSELTPPLHFSSTWLLSELYPTRTRTLVVCYMRCISSSLSAVPPTWAPWMNRQVTRERTSQSGTRPRTGARSKPGNLSCIPKTSCSQTRSLITAVKPAGTPQTPGNTSQARRHSLKS